MKWLIFLIALAFRESSATECQNDKQILELIAGSDRREEMPAASENPLVVRVGLELNSLSLVPNSNKLHMDVHLLQSWNDSALYYFHLNPCNRIINMGKYQNLIWVPEEMLSNAEDINSHRKRGQVKLTQNGTVYWIHKLQQNIPCQTHAFDYPFGNTTCSLIWRNEALGGQPPHIVWDSELQDTFLTDTAFREIGDLVFVGADFDVANFSSESGLHEELVLNLHFRRGEKKVLLLFFLPSVLFMLISWLSLCLGPMAITRSILIMMSMVLLMIHYSVNMAGLPETTGITAIDIWKIFSFLFVTSILFELVMVTCMASAGRSRELTGCCGRKGRKGNYALEPYYEELNDLRTRKTRKTCGCCRYTALAFDGISVLCFAILFVLFCVLFYLKSSQIVKYFNEVNLKDFTIEFNKE